MQVLQMYVPVTKSQGCQSQARNRERTWANTVGGARWDRVRELSPVLAPAGAAPVRSLPAAGPLWLRFIGLWQIWLVLSVGKSPVLDKNF